MANATDPWANLEICQELGHIPAQGEQAYG